MLWLSTDAKTAMVMMIDKKREPDAKRFSESYGERESYNSKNFG